MSDSSNMLTGPHWLLKFMDCIQYGWCDKNGKVFVGTDDTDENFHRFYYRQSAKKCIQSGVGVCWDQVEVERRWFQKSQFPYKTFCVIGKDDDIEPSHTFLLYNDGKDVCWFELSWGQYRGIHPYKSETQALDDIVFKHGKENSVRLVSLYKYQKPPENCRTEQQMMNWFYNSNLIQEYCI